MSKPASSQKPALSGLKTLSRDWSDAPPQPSQDIPSLYNSAPPKQREPPLTGAAKRLKDIEDALNGISSSKPSGSSTRVLGPSKSFNKRPSSELSTQLSGNDLPAAKKARQLPTGWGSNDVSSKTNYYSQSGSQSVSATAPPPSVAKPRSGKIKLSEEQKRMLKLVEDGKSVFYTGSAGTGKSVLLREIIKVMREKYRKSGDAVAITASTGIAACNIGGVTIHSFAGVGIAVEDADTLASKVKKNKKAAGRWLRTKVLIIDEVSMVEGDFFDKLCRVGQVVRKSNKPFGGIQVIVTGDFFQLPPVTKGAPDSVKFAFEAQEWGATIGKNMFNLTQVFRQTDQEFVDMLNEMRFGRLTSKSIARFRGLSRDIYYDDGILPTELFPRREDVERSNGTRLNQLSSEEHKVYNAVDGGSIQDAAQKEKMLANFMAAKRLTLRKNAQVMLIKNMDEVLVNGSLGRVDRFVLPGDYGTERDPGFKRGGAPPPASTASTATKKATAEIGQSMPYPVVHFLMPNGGSREVLIMPESFKVELPSGEIQVSRTQFPLILSWAMSIHKSQGQTLERVKVDLGRVFEKGQAYVALSRATSLEGLQVLNFDPMKVNAHPKVVEWSRTLRTL